MPDLAARACTICMYLSSGGGIRQWSMMTVSSLRYVNAAVAMRPLIVLRIGALIVHEALASLNGPARCYIWSFGEA